MSDTARLIALADLLDAVQSGTADLQPLVVNETTIAVPTAFSLEDWTAPVPAPVAKITCGTVACAVGHALFSPDFQAQGLKAQLIDDGKLEPVFEDEGTGDILVAWGAVKAFWDISGSASEYLFMDEAYNVGADASDVARRIREFVSVCRR